MDVDETLHGFADTLRRARREYVTRLEEAIEGERCTITRLQLPWWGRDRELGPEEGRASVDVLGRSTGLDRGRVDGATFVALACRALGIDPSALRSGRQDRATTRLRELVAAVGIERWDQRAGELGRALGRHPDAVSRLARMAGLRRTEDPAAAEQREALDRALAAATSATSEGE